MWWICGGVFLLITLVVIFAMCSVSGSADQLAERAFLEFLEQEKKDGE
jgi:hypothetical protein